MRNKYIYFKLFDLPNPVEDIRRFSEYDMHGLLPGVTPVDNIFQLSQQPEIKRIIEKDVSLQNALTDALPQRGRHGYLWMGQAWPDVRLLLRHLVYVKEIFCFQQALEPDPEWLKDYLNALPYREYSVYLWRVYRIVSKSFLWDRMLYIGQISRNENELDTHLKALKGELLLSPGEEDNLNPTEMLRYARPGRGGVFFPELRKVNNAHESQRRLQAWFNHLKPEREATVLQVLDGPESAVTAALFRGLNVRLYEPRPLRGALNRARAALLHTPPEEINRIINELQSKTNLLMSSTGVAQADLFMYSAEGRFIAFWNDEKRRLRTLDIPLPEPFLKYSACIRFLIETQALSADPDLNDLVRTAFILTLHTALKKKEPPSFLQTMTEYLRSFYQKRYLLSRMDGWMPSTYGVIHTERQWKEEASSDITTIYMPVYPREMQLSREERFISDILNQPAAWQESGWDYTRLNDEQKVGVREEVASNEGMMPFLPRAMRDLFTRLELLGRQEDIWRYYTLVRYMRQLLEKAGRQTLKTVAVFLRHATMREKEITRPVPWDEVVMSLVKGFKDTAHWRETDRAEYSHPGNTPAFTVHYTVITFDVSADGNDG
ncbi:MAG: hypothetical protein D6677_13710 [Calditrichaeota bacterium]|nr:MAG: hypothetical protein D6677_13710 [Calditrichota bacterium]